MAAMFGIFGIVMLAFLFFLTPDELFMLGGLVLITGMLFFAFGLTLYSIYKASREEAAPADAPHACKHCGKRFTDEKLWNLHEKTCVEMRI
jgi:hypothetical protein